MAEVSRALTITESAARELVAALEELDRLARPHGQRLSESLHTLRRELATSITRVSTHADASADDIAAQLLSDSEVMGIDTTTAAGHLGIRPDSVRWLIRRHHLDAVRIGGRWLIDRTSLQTYVAMRDRRIR